MTTLRKRKAAADHRTLARCREQRSLEDRLWDQMPPVGREFGSPDFDRLMGVDQPFNAIRNQQRDEPPNHLPLVLGC